MAIKINSGYPLPETSVPQKRVQWDNLKSRFPFDEMEVGDSFIIWAGKYNVSQIVLQNYISGAASAYRKDNPDKAFTTRQLGVSYVGCWRINPEEARGRGQ
jgi:hypothetical protein